MVFESAQLAHQFTELHPDTRRLVRDLDELLKSMKQPEVYLTSIYRTKEDQKRIYTPIGYRLLEKLRTGQPMLKREHMDALELRDAIARHQESPKEDVIRAWAGERPSWHRRRTAADVRTKSYPEDVVRAIRGWVDLRCQSKGDVQPWEVITEDHGTGPHLHLARRDWAWLPVVDTPS